MKVYFKFNKMQYKEDIDDWLERYLDGELTDEDWLTINKRIQEDHVFAKKFALDLAILRGEELTKLEPVQALKPSYLKEILHSNLWKIGIGIAASLALLIILMYGITKIKRLEKEIVILKNNDLLENRANANRIKDSLENDVTKLKTQIEVLQPEKAQKNKGIMLPPSSQPLVFQLDWQKRDGFINIFRREEAGWQAPAGNEDLGDWQRLFFKDKENGKALLAIRTVLSSKTNTNLQQDADLYYYGGVLNLYVRPDTSQIEEAVKWLRVVKDTFQDKKYPPLPYFIEALLRSKQLENKLTAKNLLKKNANLIKQLPEDIQKEIELLEIMK
jgi:hypothetical protein